MGPVKYSMDVGGISDVTADVTGELDEASGAIDGALTAVDDALGAVSAEGGLAAALRGAVEGRRTTGPNLVARAGELVRTVQANAVLYVQADESMAASTATAQEASPATNPYAGRFGSVPR